MASREAGGARETDVERVQVGTRLLVTEAGDVISAPVARTIT